MVMEAKSHDLQTGKPGLQFSPLMKARKALELIVWLLVQTSAGKSLEYCEI